MIQSERGENSYRYYPPKTLQQVQFIKKAQTLGFSLEDIGEVLNVPHQNHPHPQPGDICPLFETVPLRA